MNKRIINRYLKHFCSPYFRNFFLNSSSRGVEKNIVESLERLALVDFSTSAGIDRLEKSIQFANKLMEVNTESVEPLISTVYDRNENLRNDEPINNSNRKELMDIAPVTEEFYYVAPIGTYSRNNEKKT